MLNTSVKRGRGRPRKTESTKFTAKKTVGKTAKKRGRPLGSKNKVNTMNIADRVERVEVILALLAEIIGGLMSQLPNKKGK